MDSDDLYDTRERHEALMKVLEGLDRHRIDPSGLKNTEIIGKGGLGWVTKAIWCANDAEEGVQVAVKELFPQQHKPIRLALRFVRELRVWATFDHPQILKFLGFHVDISTKALYFVAPYLEGGSVRQHLNRNDVPTDVRKRWLLNTTDGLHYLHSLEPPVVHGDLKAENLLVTDEGSVVLCDFGLSSVMEDAVPTGLTTSGGSGFEGSIRWCSPELLRGSRRTTASDVWAWALCVLEIMTGRIPFGKQVEETVIATRLTVAKRLPSCDDYPELPKNDPLWTPILGCLNISQRKRWTIDACRTIISTVCDTAAPAPRPGTPEFTAGASELTTMTLTNVKYSAPGAHPVSLSITSPTDMSTAPPSPPTGLISDASFHTSPNSTYSSALDPESAGQDHTLIRATSEASREPELYGVLDGNDLYSSLRPPDSQYIGQHPSFHPPPHTADFSALHPESLGQDCPRSRTTSETSGGQTPVPVTPLIQGDAFSADQTEQSWYDEDADAWKPTENTLSQQQHSPILTRPRSLAIATPSVTINSTSFCSKPVPPAAIPDVPELPSPNSKPVEDPLPRRTFFVVNADPDTSESELLPVQDLRKELPPLPLNLSGSRKPKEGSDSRASPVPPISPQFQASRSPPPSLHVRRPAMRRKRVAGTAPAFPPPAPSAGAASIPYWASPAVSRFPSASSSLRTSSTRTTASSAAFTSTSFRSTPSSVAFTSDFFQSNPSVHPSAILDVPDVPSLGSEHIENPLPRQTLFVINADPDASEYEPSPVQDLRKELSPLLHPAVIPDVPDLPSPSSAPIEDHLPRQTLFVVNADPDTSESELSPVQDLREELPPPLPINPSGPRKPEEAGGLRAPPIPVHPLPSYPHLGDRSEPAVPTQQPSGGEHDRSISVPPNPPRSSSMYSNGRARLSDSDGASSSSSSPGHKVKCSKPVLSTTTDSDIPAEWIYPLPLTLEELFKGGKYTYRVISRLLSGESKVLKVEINVQAGWKSGTRIVFPGAGHERRPGIFQDMIFVVEQVHHKRFARLDGGRLVCNQDIDLEDALKEGPRPTHYIVGIDERVIEFSVPQGVIKPGTETVIKGEGMHRRLDGKVVSRGDLIVKWNICFSEGVSQDQLLQMQDVFPQ